MTISRHARVLLLGPTGIDKNAALKSLAEQVASKLGQDFRAVDFENEFLKPSLAPPRNWTNYLAQDTISQAGLWKSAWQEFSQTIDDRVTILSLHATYVSSAFGLRCPINIPLICADFKPTLIISLIDDVQAMWRRTEERAGGELAKGRPTMEQLASARRADQILGDVILTHTGDRKARHVVCASGNCIDALINLVFFNASVTYISFPISAPREMLANGDDRFVAVINEAHKLAAAQMKSDRQRAFISPLAIDELPFVFAVPSDPKVKDFNFNCATDRWSSPSLWEGASEPIVPPLNGPFSYPRSEVEAAASLIKTDVGWRDRRLVLQSNSLSIVCPKPPGEERITRGVQEEITTAIGQGISCNIWQKPDWDVDDFIGRQFPEAGSMGLGQTQVLVKRFASLPEMIAARPQDA